MAIRKKHFLVSFGLLVVLLAGAAGAAGYFLTRPLATGFTQSPNSFEADEANRKLKLLSEAQTTRKQGFVRFSEVEINSFLDGSYRNATTTGTNDSPVRLVKAGVLLDDHKITFVTWHRANLLGIDLPLVWQRVITPRSSTNGWSFAVRSMKVGAVEIPEGQWSRVEQILGSADSLFEERKSWLKTLPLVSLAKNELSESPEVRLYTYLPQEKSMANESKIK